MNFIQTRKNRAQLAFTTLAVLTMSALSTIANAAATDFTALTTAVDFSTVVTAVLAVAALLAVVYVAMKGARMVLGFIRR